MRPLELVHVRPCEREARRPDKALLILHVEIIEAYGLRRVDLVLRDVRAGRELEDVESPHDLAAHHHAVVPVDGPGAAEHETRRIVRAAIEEADFDRM